MTQSPIQLVLNTSSQVACTALLDNLFQCLTNLTVKNVLFIADLKVPALILKLFPLVLRPCEMSLTSSLERRIQVLEGCGQASLEPFLLQNEQPQLSQPVFIREILQGTPLDFLQQVHSSYVEGLRAGCNAPDEVSGELSTWQNQIPQHSCHSAFDTAQDIVVFVSCEHILLGMSLLATTHILKSFSTGLLSIHSLPTLCICGWI